MGQKLKLNRATRESGSIYAGGLVHACELAAAAATGRKKGKAIDPAKVLTDTDDYPEVTQGIEQAEFLVGWFHGVADALGLQVETLWEAFESELPTQPTKERKLAPKPKAPAKPKAAKPAKPPKATKKPRKLDAKTTAHAADVERKLQAKSKPAKATKPQRAKAKKGARTEVTFEQLVRQLEGGRKPKAIVVHVEGHIQAGLAASLCAQHNIDVEVIDRKAA
jgi:hypothetical protein